MSCEDGSCQKAVGQPPNMHQAIVGLVEQAKRLNMVTVDGIGAEWSGTVDRQMNSGRDWRWPAFSAHFRKRNRKFETKMLRMFRNWDADRETITKLPAPSVDSLASALTLTKNMVESYRAAENQVDRLIGDSLTLYNNLIHQSQMHRNIQLVQQLEIETNDRILGQRFLDLDREHVYTNGLEIPRGCFQQCGSLSIEYPEHQSMATKTDIQDGALVAAAIVNIHQPSHSSQGDSKSLEEMVQSLKGVRNFCEIMTNYSGRFKHKQILLTHGDASVADTRLLLDQIRVRCQRNIDFYKMMIVAEAELMNLLLVNEAVIAKSEVDDD